MKSTKITVISGLGVGDEKRNGEWRYPEYEYELHGKRSQKKPLIAQALCELLPEVRRDGAKVDRAVFLGTPKVEEIWSKSGLLRRGLPGVDVEFVTTPEGKTQGELWEITTALTSILEADETQDPDGKRHYYIEAMQGYRPMLLLATSAINLALAEWSRRHRRNPPQVTLLYGAWEVKTSDGLMPLWDLTDLITAGRWSNAVGSAQRGQAEELAAAAASLSGDWAGEEGDDESGAGALADTAQAFSRDVSFGRLRELFAHSAPALIEQLDSAGTKALLARLPSLQGAVDELRKAVEPFRAADVVGAEGLRATVAFARLNASLGRPADEAAALREAIVTHYGRSTRRVPMIEPGTKGFARQRERVTAELADLWKRASEGPEEERAAFLAALPPALREPLDHLKPLEALRADLSRLSFAEKSQNAGQLAASLKTRLSSLAALLEGPPAPSIFINFSETPVESWAPEQAEAARALGLGDAADLLGALPSLNAAVVGELQGRGVRCFAPARKKDQFVRFRPFARPAAEDE